MAHSYLVATPGFSRRELFDVAAFERELATHDARTVFRDALKHGSEVLRQRFLQGIAAQDLVPARAWLIDQLLQHAWRRFFDEQNPDVALVAVGGYGRGELHPYSDVDILILLGIVDVDSYREAVESFLAFLWDMRLEIGHSVRSLDECVRQAASDITIATSLMEARFLIGAKPLFEQLIALTGNDQLWTHGDFFRAKRTEQQQRYRKYNGTAYNLEPNVKEGPGGLRDLQVIGWVAKRHFGANTLHDLVDHQFLTEQEYRELIKCQNFLWQVRFALHILAKRREDTLLFDYQRTLAQQFGYRDRGANLAVEQFMQRYYRVIMELSRLNEMLLQLFEEAILYADDPGEPIPINRHFQIRKGFLEVTHPDTFSRYPIALFEVFLLLQQHPELNGMRASTIRLICAHRHLIDASFRNDVRAQNLFIKILRQPQGVTHQLRRMNQYGLLAAYLPEFAKIVGRMQYDLFHAYTVDQHILFVVRNLRRFCASEFAHEFPDCSSIIRRITKPMLLYIAAIYHDIAKGRGGDHSELGALDAKKFCRRHGLSKVDTGLIVWLVQHHLVMSLTAQKKDIDDPEVIYSFARFVGDQKHLDYLYILTVADIRATNPKLWNSWRASLLQKLYESTRRALRRGLGNPIDKEDYIKEIRAQALEQLQLRGIQAKRVKQVWDGFGDDYFLRMSTDEIVWHTRAILKHQDVNRTLVLAHPNTARGGTEVFVYTRDNEALFARMVSILDHLRLTVLDARIITGQCGYVLDSYTVIEDSGEPIQSHARIREIITTLRRLLDQADYRPTPAKRRIPRVLKHFRTPTQVFFNDDEVNQRTVMELITSDRPGLLSRVGQVFVEYGIQLQSAKIATIGERAEDVFFITDRHFKPIPEGATRDALAQRLTQYLDESE